MSVLAYFSSAQVQMKMAHYANAQSLLNTKLFMYTKQRPFIMIVKCCDFIFAM